MPNPTMYALLIGIDKWLYPKMPPLAGCVNDVELMAETLRNRFAVPGENIRVLRNNEATRANILAAIREQLIDRAKAWKDANDGSPSPAFVLHYAGHGSRAKDGSGTQPDGKDETIVPYDSRVGDVYDIRDWELGQLLDELSGYTDNVTVFLDCCHSGSGTRNDETVVRIAEPDMRDQPTSRPVAFRSAAENPKSSTGQHALLAACRSHEYAHEHVVVDGDEMRRHGAMTYFLVHELNRIPPTQPLTYGELHRRVRFAVNAEYASQMPQCEGDRHRLLFGGIRPPHQPMLSVIQQKGGLVTVDGGAAHGLTIGSELHVYPEGTRVIPEVRSDSPTTSATLIVEKVDAVSADCRVETGNPPELHSRAAIARLNYGNMRRSVATRNMSSDVQQRLANRLASEDCEPYVQLIDNVSLARFVIEEADGFLRIVDRGNKLLVAPFPLDDIDGVANDLKSLVRYFNALELQNRSTSSDLSAAVSIRLYEVTDEKLVETPVGEGEKTARPLRPVKPMESSGGEPVVKIGQSIAIEVQNNSDENVYCEILNFSYDYEIRMLFHAFEGTHKQIPPSGSVWIGRDGPLLQFQPPADPNVRRQFVEDREFIKVIATVDESDFTLLAQGPLKSPYAQRRSESPSGLNALFEQAMMGGNKRALGPVRSQQESKWGTSELEYIVSRADEDASRALVGGQETELPDYDISINAPPGFDGTVQIVSESAAVRSEQDNHLPAGFFGFTGYVQPLQLRATRSNGSPGQFLEIEASDESCERVNEDAPLKLICPSATSGQTIAVARHGDFFLPVGFTSENETEVLIEWLPTADATENDDSSDEAVQESTRSVGRTIQLYLYKLAGWKAPDLGIHKARFIPDGADATIAPEEHVQTLPTGQVALRRLNEGEIKSGDRVALLVHGFQSDTFWMVGPIDQISKRVGPSYDHVLTFDYESFNTPIGENGTALAETLRAIGLSADDGIHLDVIAHSMGTLVTRSMIELFGGDKFVDRCFLAGPPNRGTLLADSITLMPWVATVLLNSAAASPPTMFASWAARKLSGDAVGPLDLRPTSEFLRRLNRDPVPSNVEYYVLAGKNAVGGSTIKNLWDAIKQRFAQAKDTTLDLLFGGDHDLVIGVQSMQTLNAVQSEGRVETKIVDCDHFSYLSDRQSLDQLANWLSSNER